jgi:cytochrome d ubiquinol oxidase subunit I
LENLFAARAVFGMSLSFHIMFAALGVVMPFFLLLSQGLYLRRKNPVYLALNKKWTTAFAITYAIGAVSGTVLTFGLGLFWPRFMDFAGPMIGVPLSIEVMFFLLEAIFLGIYLFGRDMLSPWLHWASAIPLFIGGFASMIVVILANSWMNTPVGFEVNEAGEVIDVDVLAAMFSPSWYAETSHMAVAANSPVRSPPV